LMQKIRYLDKLVDELAKGKSMDKILRSWRRAEIARELYVSPNTVKTQCSAIYRKLAVTTRKGAVQAAREQRLLWNHRRECQDLLSSSRAPRSTRRCHWQRLSQVAACVTKPRRNVTNTPLNRWN